MSKRVEFMDDLSDDDMHPDRVAAISKEAAARLIERHGPGQIHVRSHEGFEDGYNWIEVTLTTNSETSDGGEEIYQGKQVSHWGEPSATFDSLSSFKGSTIPEGISQIALGRGRLNLLLRSRPSRNLIVSFSHAAQRAPGKTPPFFAGVDITKDIDASFLAIDDPALQCSEDIGVGWHAGATDFPLQQILPPVIRQVIEQTKAERVILTGGSSGGFASLYFGAVMPETIVLVFNPQTDILRYSRGHFERYARVCFGWDGKQPIEGVFGATVTCLPKLYHEGARTNAIYLQNADDWHVKPHTLPLIRAVGGMDEAIDQRAGGIYFVFRKWGEGHAPLPNPAYKAALQHLAERGHDGLVNAIDDALAAQMVS